MRDEELEIDKEAIVTRKEFVMIEVCVYCECGGPVPPQLSLILRQEKVTPESEISCHITLMCNKWFTPLDISIAV